MNKIMFILALLILAIWYLTNTAEGIFQTVYAAQDVRNSEAIRILFGK